MYRLAHLRLAWIGLLLLFQALPPPALCDDRTSERPETLRILTYNIQRPDNSTLGRISSLIRGEALPTDRSNAILSLIAQHAPDIIALQEITPTFVKLLTSADLLSEYTLVHTLSERQLSESYYLQEPDGVAILSKHPVHVLVNRILDRTRLRRRLFIVRIDANGSPLTLGVCHLDSLEPDSAVRAYQLRQFFTALAPAPNAILLGDFNFGDGRQPESAALLPDYQDPWLRFHPDDPGLTFRDDQPGRLDRILIRTRDWLPNAVELIGAEAGVVGGRDKRFPSDHLGVLATLRRR